MATSLDPTAAGLSQGATLATEPRVARVDPHSGEPLVDAGDALVGARSGHRVAPIVGGIPRFVAPENYAGSFGWQWNHWEHIRSHGRGAGLGLRRTILERTHFEAYETAGKTLLECGMGGGDDTEVLLDLPFAEVHAFDLSNAVERAARTLRSDRLHIAQASIYEIPYPDQSFDFVYCHRVLQHTPDPERALRSICAKVKPGGVLFAHSYKRSWRYMLEWRYKWRWLTKRLPHAWIHAALERFGPALHHLNERLYRRRPTMWLAYNFVPFYRHPARIEGPEKIELEKLVTFDALTPAHDHPMSTRRFRSIIESEGFRIEHLFDPPTSPIYCTAVRGR